MSNRLQHTFAGSTLIVLAGLLSLGAAPAAAQQGLSLATAQPLMAETVTATGRVQPLISARIGARVSGRLAAMGTTEDGRMLDVGMTVKAGQVLFQLDETTFRNAVAIAEAQRNSAKASLANLTAPTRAERLDQYRQALAEVDARLADKQRDELRYKRLVEEEKTMPVRRLEEVQTEVTVLKALRRAASARLEEAESGPTPTEIAVAQARVTEAEAALKMAQDDLRDATVRAPFDGLVTERFKSPGDYLVNMPPTEVVALVAQDKLEVDLRLPEAYLAAVQPGTTAVTLQSPLLAKALALPVARVVQAVDAAKGTFAIRVTIPADQPSGLVPGAFVTAAVQVGRQARGVIVPLRAIFQAGEQAVVYIAQDGKMVRRPVEVGERLTESVIVLAGLAGGEKVLVGPQESLTDGAALPEYLKAAK